MKNRVFVDHRHERADQRDAAGEDEAPTSLSFESPDIVSPRMSVVSFPAQIVFAMVVETQNLATRFQVLRCPDGSSLCLGQ